MKTLLNKCKKLYNKETPLKIEWIVAITIGIIMILMFNYIDFKSLTVWSTNILDCIADGDITQYYSYTALNKYEVAHQYVSGPLHNIIIWSVWNIPIWLIQYFLGVPIVNNAMLLIWSKLFLVLSLGITLFITYKICCILFENKKTSKWITFLSATSVFTYIGVFYAGQTDILICMFAILGLYYLIKEKNLWFYMFSSLAISIKYFYLIPYIPLILLTEKKIWKIIVKLGIGVLPIIIFKFLVKGFPMYGISEASNNSSKILQGFFGSGIKVANEGVLSFFILTFAIICFIAYMTKPKTKEIKNNYIFYFTTAPSILMFMFSTHYEFYRIILLIPFLMILYGFKPQLFRINIILDTLMSACYFISIAITSDYMLNSKYSMRESLITRILGVKEMKTINLKAPITDLLGENVGIVLCMLTTIVFATLAIILVINYPKINLTKESEDKDEKPERWIIWIRQLIIVPAIAYLLFRLIKG